jgi:hypothetical protein
MKKEPSTQPYKTVNVARNMWPWKTFTGKTGNLALISFMNWTPKHCCGFPSARWFLLVLGSETLKRYYTLCVINNWPLWWGK